MNSLTELNTYSDSFTITYDDERLGKLILDRTTGTNQSITVDEGDQFSLPVGVEIIEVVNYATTNPTYIIDITTAYAEGVTLDFGTLPAGVSVANSLGRYTVSGITSAGIWNQIKAPTVVLPATLPDAYYGNFTAEVDLDWIDALSGNLNISYTVAVSVLDVNFLSNPLESYFDPSATTAIESTPLIIDVDSSYPGAEFTISATVSTTAPIDTIASAYASGGTFTFNNSTKAFTIVGTRAQVNGHLSNLSITATSSGVDVIITYVLTNDQDAASDSKQQTLRNSDVRYLGSASSGTYVEDTLSPISGYPTITDNNYVGSASYTLTITPDNTSKVSKIYGSERDQITTTVLGTVDSITTTVSITQLTVGQQYIIVYIGDAGNESNFTTVGAATNSVGTIFTATGTGTGGGLVEVYPVFRYMKFLNTTDDTGNSIKLGGQSPIADQFRFGNYTNYTIEMWIKTVAGMSSNAPTTGSTSACSFFIGRNDQTVTASFGFNKDGHIIFNWYNDLTGYTHLIESTASRQLDTWQHIAFVKQNSTIKLYVDGVVKATGTMTTLLPRVDNLGQDVYPAIGGHYYGDHSQIREFRVSDTARYTSTFTPASSFTNDANTLCLIHGQNTGGTYIDINTSRNGTFADDNTDIVTGGDESFNNSTKVLTITGTKSVVNQRLGYLKIKPATDIDSTILLDYDLTTPESNTATKTQSLFLSGSDLEMSNGSVSRNYIGNRGNLIFATDTPQITDNEPPGYITNYTVYFSCSFGDFTINDTAISNPFSISGTRAYVNSQIASVKFYPDVNVSSNGTMTMELQKNSVTTATFTINLLGTAGTYQAERDVEFFTTQNWTPTIADVLYGKISELTVVGGGGGGSAGGGGGGQVKYTNVAGDIVNNGVLTLSSYSVTVGAGGSAGNSTIGASGSDGSTGGTSSGFGLSAVGGGGGKKVDSYGSGSITGGEGGYSYAPNGTLYSGGTASYLTGSLSRYGILGGGGAGSGGTETRFSDSEPRSTIDAPTDFNDINFGADGGLGYYADLGGVINVSDNNAPNFGFGAGGGRFLNFTGGGGGAGGYRDSSTSTVYSSGADRYYDSSDGNPNSSIQVFPAQDTPRTSAVAGGGGGGGAPGDNSATPPGAGGDGIVIIRLISK